MKREKITSIVLAFTILISFSASAFCGFSNPAEIAATDGMVVLTFTSVADSGNFSPRHVLAVWAEKEDGTFVKSLKVQADKRKQYLYTWNTKSSGNTTDAITGETLKEHETHVVTWDLSDVTGALVDDGNYVIKVEYTSEHAQGPLLSVLFTKGTALVSLLPANETYFEGISLSYIPETTGIDAQNESGINVYPIPASEKVMVDYAEGYIINIYDHSGKVVRSMEKIPSDHFEIDITGMENGSYIMVGTDNGSTFRQIFQVIR
jgi:hypothetical protein